MTTPWDPEQYRDSYRERVEDLISRKGRGEEIVREGEPAEESNVTDLMEALRQSAEQMRKTGKRKTGKAGETGKTGETAKTRSVRKAGPRTRRKAS